MGWITRLTLTASIGVAGLTGAFAAALQPSNSPAVASRPSLDAVIGKKLVSIDGSAVTLTVLEGALIRETIAANGATRRTGFNFLSDQLGTVADPLDPNKAVGVFRIGQRDVTIQYADGGSEVMFVTAEGGLLIEATDRQASTVCSAWYPEGHVFSLDERKDAVAQYASRLGIAESGTKETPVRKSSPACGERVETAAAEPVKKPFGIGGGENVLAAGLGLSALATSQAAPAPTSALAIAQLGRATDGSLKDVAETGTTKIPTPAPAFAEAGRATPEQFAQTQSPRDGIVLAPKGASKCLSVESERGYRGFRNYCAYPVQFAYCVVGRRLEPTSCQYGAVQGSTEAWGFSALGDRPLSPGDTPIGLRWIACRGRAGDVLPRLEQIDPPSGHCVPVAH